MKRAKKIANKKKTQINMQILILKFLATKHANKLIFKILDSINSLHNIKQIGKLSNVFLKLQEKLQYSSQMRHIFLNK